MDAHKNFAYSTVAVAPVPATSGLALTVQTGEGALFPAVPFNATVWPAGSNALSTNAEIVRVTANVADVFTIVRAQESTAARTVIVGDQIAATITALTFSDIETPLKSIYPGICQGRLTLAPGFANYAPQPATPSSTDTGTEIVTFAADPGWATGTLVSPVSTLGGLTTGTRYYFGRLSGTTGAFYTTLADANANTNKVNLTASITQSIVPSGIQQTSLQFSPFNGNLIGLYSGSVWNVRTFAETAIALGTLTNDQGYDVFCYDNSGTPAFELLAWTSKTARATAIVLQDGIPVKSGDATRRLLGSFLTDSTTTTIDDGGGIASQVGAKRFVSNVYNDTYKPMRVYDGTTSWNYSTNTWRQGNGAAGNKLEFFVSVNRDIQGELLATCGTSASGTAVDVGVGLDSITATPFATSGLNASAGIPAVAQTAMLDAIVGPGYHYMSWMESGNGTVTGTFFGRLNATQSGFSGAISC